MTDARQKKRNEVETALVIVEDIIQNHEQNSLTIFNMVQTVLANSGKNVSDEPRASYSMSRKIPAQVAHMNRLTKVTDVDCISNLRMDRNAFGRLCRILRDRCGLVDQRYVRVEEQVAMFLITLAHHTKNRIVGFTFLRSKHTVSIGSYYLCDNGYANSEGFLTPFKGVRYHLKEWGPNNQRPNSAKELFNMRHTMARNVIERAFAILKMLWGILRSASFYPIATQTRLIMCCFLLHNYIRGEMGVDPVEAELDERGDDGAAEATGTEVEPPAEVQFVDTIEASPGWNQKRVDLANYMWENQ